MQKCTVISSSEHLMSYEKQIKCDLCEVTLTTQQDKEEHIKLEHGEGHQPTGVT